ncbi:Sensor protein FixL [Pirellula sp. SH-Sr6A]|uniref:two-component system sensor histidine kinase NtrB n=1 Tax=Pirellula sp. SH-Sr6A TaxID=1632865 RepID=UPI00078CECE8|nr:PAS domain S-box protein [Pirellula sp. SH-Sr6A]AMV31809.1 Sensor protein FixL [Pirellula sp. SH-Sr6A]
MTLEKGNLNELDSALLDAVLNTAVDAIVTIDARGKILHANRSVEKLFGYKPQDLINQNVSVLMPEPDRSRHDGYVQSYNETGKRKIIGIGRQVLGQRADGSLIPIDLAISEVHVGDRILYTGIMRDMTERQQNEADLRDAQLRLIQSERLAAIGQMVTGLAHESRNALQRSRACLDMLDLDLETAPEQQDLVRRTRSALVELQTLYEEVRSYAAPIQLGKTRQTVSELCLDVWNNLSEVWTPIKIKLVLNCEACPAIYCDASRISQVIRNIYENSLAVVPSNSVLYTTCRPICHGSQQYLQVAFTDDGPGLDDEQKRRIFEPFYTTKTKGTGLGMAICNRLVEAHAGKIYVGNNEHRHPDAHGAVIVMELPM